MKNNRGSAMISGLLVSVLLLSSISAQAVTLKTTRKPAAEKDAIHVLSRLKKCVDEGRNTSMIRACAQSGLSQKLNEHAQDKILMWFNFPYEISEIETCPQDILKFIPDDKLRDIKQTVCSQYTVENQIYRAIFFFTDEGGLRLANIKAERIAK